MRHVERFLYNLKYFINYATAIPGTGPEDVSRKILIALTAEKNSAQDEKEFARFIRERSIDHLVHFTHTNNLITILEYGLIPRIYLEEEAIRITIRPAFADNQRIDGLKEANCLSISYPNYRMFFKKSQYDRDSWVVLFLDSRILEKHACLFSPLNSASRFSTRETGVNGARKLFSDLKLRSALNLPPHYTTNPEAEVLELSVVPPKWIKEIHVFSRTTLQYFQSHAKKAQVPIKVDQRYYEPRRDYRYWQSRPAFRANEDYRDVLAHEMNRGLGT